ncbi:MAG: NAD(P)H-hydrate dehydratase [Verrucomicrobia bacterium]|nr:MAG: NAD(P)H-hydrate dehydratase [Verrucomicrobiota bacterium]
MKVVSVAQMRELDRRAAEEFNIPSEELMDRAGDGVAEIVEQLADLGGFRRPFVLLVAGRGNNGGDALAAAYYLKSDGFDCEVWIAGTKSEVKGDALKQLSRARQAGVPIHDLPTKEDWDAAEPIGADIIVDGVLGIGASGPARGPAIGAIQFINACSPESLVVSIDVPSGLDADTGRTEGEAVVADITATIGLPKPGLLDPAALEHVGVLDVVDIGIPPQVVAELPAESELEFVHRNDMAALLPRRRRGAHKGDFGRVLLIGGARGYSGAITLAAQAAVRGGAGLVKVAVPQSIVTIVANQVPEAMVLGLDETEVGSLSVAAWKEIEHLLEEADAVLIGPGLTVHKDSFVLVRNLVRTSVAPFVLDADALNALQGQPHFLAKSRAPIVITPHPGEMARLFGQTVEQVQRDRRGVTIAAAKYTNGTVVLKGAGTLIAQKDLPLAVNLTGNPGMATGGAGDVLAGLLTALLGQHVKPYDAARLAVFLHGRSGDHIAWRKSQAGLTASDLVEEIPFVFRDLAIR